MARSPSTSCTGETFGAATTGSSSSSWQRPWPRSAVYLWPMPVGALMSPNRSFTRATLSMIVLVPVLLWPRPTVAAPVPVRLVEGVTHGFLVLRAVTGVAIASGDLLQSAKGGVIESRMIFRFKDGSVFDETVMFTQERVFTL